MQMYGMKEDWPRHLEIFFEAQSEARADEHDLAQRVPETDLLNIASSQQIYTWIILRHNLSVSSNRDGHDVVVAM
jgi:hypothetical protein